MSKHRQQNNKTICHKNACIRTKCSLHGFATVFFEYLPYFHSSIPQYMYTPHRLTETDTHKLTQKKAEITKNILTIQLYTIEREFFAECFPDVC